MSEILTHNRSNNTCFDFKPRSTRMQTMNLQVNEGPNGQANMVALGDFHSALSTFDPGKLFEAAMVNLDLPGIQGMMKNWI